MSKIFISTNRDSANVCFGRGEGNKRIEIEGLLNISTEFPIHEFGATKIFIHFDYTNPEFDIDKNNDYLLYHSCTHTDFHNKFSYKEYSNHPGKFKKVFEILIDDTIRDKYTAIKTTIFPNFEDNLIGIIGGQFINGGIKKEQIEQLLGVNFNDTILAILEQNAEFHKKKCANQSTEQEKMTNVKNWKILHKALKDKYLY